MLGHPWHPNHAASLLPPAWNTHAHVPWCALVSALQTKAKSGKYNFDAKKKVKVVVRISVGGLATINLKSGTFITKNPVHRILGWFPDAKEKDVFGIVVKGEGRQLSGPADEFCCVVLKSPQAVSALAAIKQLMAIVFHAPAADKESPSMSPGAGKAAVDPNKWDCIDCHFFNKNDDLECVMCGCGKNAEPVSTLLRVYWRCPTRAPTGSGAAAAPTLAGAPLLASFFF